MLEFMVQLKETRSNGYGLTIMDDFMFACRWVDGCASISIM